MNQEFKNRNQAPDDGLRVQPHNIEAEEAVLAACMLGDGGKLVMADCLSMKFTAETFYKTSHQVVFGVLVELFRANEPLTDIAVFDRLQVQGKMEDVGGHAAIYAIQNRIETATSARYYANIVLQKWKQRSILRSGRELIEAVYEPAENFDEVRKRIQAPLTVMGDLSVNEIATDAVAEVERLIERKRLEFAGKSEEVPDEHRLSLWMPKIEEDLGPIDRRESDNLIYIGAPSSRGKSSLMRQIVNANLVLHESWRVVVFVLEGGGPKYLHHMACGFARIPNRKHHDWLMGEIAKGNEAAARANVKAKKYFKHLEFLKSQLNTRLFIFEKDRVIDDIVGRCRELEARLGVLDLVVVDYVQLVQSSKQNANREQQVAEVSNKLQGLQVSLGCPMVVGTQLNADGEARESKAIFNDSTRFLRISRPEKDKGGVDQTELGKRLYHQIIEQQKNRNGETALVAYDFHCYCGAFVDFGAIPADKRGRPANSSNNEAKGDWSYAG